MSDLMMVRGRLYIPFTSLVYTEFEWVPYSWKSYTYNGQYNGQWKNGYPNGQGTTNFYTGEWKDGKPHGQGTFSYADGKVYKGDVYEGDFVNIGRGAEISMGELYQEVSKTVMYSGKLVFDTSKPDGTISKVMDINKILSLGWKPKTDIRTGLRLTYEWYLNNKS